MTSLSFHQQGEVCVTARNDGVVSVLNCLSGMYVCASHYLLSYIAKQELIRSLSITHAIGSQRRS